MDIPILKAGQSGFGILIENDAGYISPKDYNNSKTINEIVNNNKTENGLISEPLIVTVVLQKYGVKNRNGRVYPEDILRREAERYQTLINERRALGESDHPDTSIISVRDVANNITKIWWEGKTLLGEMEIIMSPGFKKLGICSTEGDRVANLLLQGYMVGVSSRGVGSLEESGGNQVVQDDFEIICWDIVTAPSTPGSWMFRNREDSKPFVESVNKGKNLLIKGIDNFLLNE